MSLTRDSSIERRVDAENADAIEMETLPTPLLGGDNLPAKVHLHTECLTLNEQQRTLLESPIPEDDLDIKPTGEVYASQVRYRRVLNKVFGPGGWRLVELSEPALKDSTVFQKWGLITAGVMVSVAWGDQEYFPSNARMTYATALESAKSNALMRCCKDLGIASECWDRRFCEEWKAKNAVQVWIVSRRNQSGFEKAWRRKDAAPFWNERERKDSSSNSQTSAGPVPPTSGQGASGGARSASDGEEPPPPTRRRAAAPPSPKIDQSQLEELLNACEETDVDPLTLCAQFHIPTADGAATAMRQITVAQYEEAQQIFAARRKNRGGQ